MRIAPYHAVGRMADAEAAFARIWAALGNQAPTVYAEIYAQWGRSADAIGWLQAADRAHDGSLLDPQNSPLLDPVSAAPAVREMATRLGLQAMP